MALTDFLDLELTVPDPSELEAFWNRRGLLTTGTGQLGTKDRESQLRLKEGDYRHVSQFRVACESEQDIIGAAKRLSDMGIASQTGDGWLECIDPIQGHTVRLEVTKAVPLSPREKREINGPGELNRVGRRSEAAMKLDLPVPRRVGHVVFGSPDVAANVEFYTKGLGFRVSDNLSAVGAVFIRCSTDHHNMLLLPAPVPCMNHYALEMNDFDGIGLRGVEVVEERPDATVYGIGRHVIGSNVFWYLLDPAGGMFEFFADMDQIVDDEKWAREQYKEDWDPFTVATYESGVSKMDFFLPTDIDEIAKGRERAGL